MNSRGLGCSAKPSALDTPFGLDPALVRLIDTMLASGS